MGELGDRDRDKGRVGIGIWGMGMFQSLRSLILITYHQSLVIYSHGAIISFTHSNTRSIQITHHKIGSLEILFYFCEPISGYWNKVRSSRG